MELKNFYTQDTQGNILPGAQVYVYQRGTSNLVSVFDSTGNPKTNPFPSDDDALATFAVANGVYDVRVVSGERDTKLPMQFFDTAQGMAAVAALVEQAQAAADEAESSASSINSQTTPTPSAVPRANAEGHIDPRWLVKRIINVMDPPYNAKLDGSFDDSAAIQAAINDAPAGSTIEIPTTPTGGVATGLVINKLLHFKGDEAKLRQRAGSTTPLITYFSVAGFKLKGLKLDGNKANQTTQTNVVEINGCANFKLFDIDIDGGSYCGLKIDGNTDAHPTKSSLVRVKCTRNGYSGIMLYNARRLNLTDCGGSNNAGFGLFYDSATEEAGSDISLLGGEYDYNGYSGVSFPYFNYTGLKGKCGKARISNISSCNNGQNGVILQGIDKRIVGSDVNFNGITGVLVNGQQCIVNNNDLKYNTSVGVDWGDCKDITCVGNQAIGNGDMGIEVNSCEGGVVTGNTVNGNNKNVNGLKAGIVLQLGSGGYPFVGPCRNIAVTGNFVGPGPNQDYGILLTADTSGCMVADNATTASGLVQDIKCVSAFNIVTPGASRASHMGASSQITIATAATVTIPDAAEVVFLTGTVNVATITCGNLYAGRQLTLVFNSSTPQILNTGNILTAVNPVANWRPIKLVYIKSLEKWAIIETKTF